MSPKIFWRVSFFSIVLVVAAPSAASAQSGSGGWTVGMSGQAVFMEGVPTGRGGELFATWHRSPAWGVRLGIRRDAAIQRDLQKAFRDNLEWTDQRRTSITPALLWRPIQSERGGFSQSLQFHLGPTLQFQRGEQVRRIGAADRALTVERLTGDPGFEADNIYLDRAQTTPLLLLTDDTDRTNVGASLGLHYGFRYDAVTVRSIVMARKVTNIDGVTFGIGGSVGIRL